ncbi:MAG: Nif3-like dinuclear metal center hexameric protein [Acidobacteriota bacterium]
MARTLTELVAHLDSFLEVGRFQDDALNGLQVEGKAEVRRVAVAVSACREAFGKAAAVGADALIVHHGLLWKGDWPRAVRGVHRERLRLLLDSNLSLLAYHLPLDAHPQVGNNARAAIDLGLQDLKPFAVYHGTPIGTRGRFPSPRPRSEFLEQLEAYYGHPAFVEAAGPEIVSTVGICSGGAAREASEAVTLGLDAYVTGEPGEPEVFLCREAAVTFAALGHHATEKVGVRALGDYLREALGLEVVFLDMYNEA